MIFSFTFDLPFIKLPKKVEAFGYQFDTHDRELYRNVLITQLAVMANP